MTPTRLRRVLLQPPFFDVADDEMVAMLDEFLQLPGLASGAGFIDAYGEPKERLDATQKRDFFNKLLLEEYRPDYLPHQSTMDHIAQGMWKLRKTKTQKEGKNTIQPVYNVPFPNL